MSIEFWTLAIALVTAFACALCGAMLVVKREAMVSEGLSHAVLPGIIVAFVLLRDRSSVWLILGAAAFGLIMVLLVLAIRRTRIVDADASLGIVFAAMFSVGIILAHQELRNTHFHAHCIIDGNLALSPLDTVDVGPLRWVPRSFLVMFGVLACVVTFIAVYFKELKLSMFDESLARSFGFRPVVLHLVWLSLVSITTVSAFETAGSILVVALMITPPAAASLMTNRLTVMLLLSCVLAGASAVIGFWVGLRLDISPTGPMSAVAGGLFLLILLFAKRRGLLAKWRYRIRQQRVLDRHMVLLQLANNARRDASQPYSQETLLGEFSWSRARAHRALHCCLDAGYVAEDSKQLQLTDQGCNHLRACEVELGLGN